MKKNTMCVICIMLLFVFLTSCSPKLVQENLNYPTQKETEHFIINGNSMDCVEEIASALESQYQSFYKHLSISLSEKMTITIYPSKEKLNMAVPNKNPSSNSYGDEVNGIMTVLPDNETFEQYIFNLCTGSIYINLQKYNSKLPPYLISGISGYETASSKKVTETVSEAVAKNSIPTIKELNDIKEDDVNSVYPYSYSLVDFIVSEYGYNKLKEMIDTPDIKTVFNISEQDFYNKWLEYLRKMYPVLSITKETEHFIFHYTENDEKASDDMSEILEKSYADLKTKLQTEPTNKCVVDIYPTFESLQKAYSKSYSEHADVIGAAQKDGFIITSPNDYAHSRASYEETLQGAIHELVHVFIIDYDVPLYLNEGLAYYEQGALSNKAYILRFALNSQNGYSIPNNIQEFSTMSAFEQNGAVYIYGAAFVDYIINTYGYNGIVRLINSKGDISSLGLDEASIYNDWIKYIKINYQ